MAHQELITRWLQDAYGMEKSLIQMQENQIKDAKDNPDMRTRLETHKQETERHAELVKDRLQRLGADVSTVKTVLGNVMGALQGMSLGGFDDELVKTAIVGYSAEHFEIASYRALIDGSRRLGDDDTARICETILHDEERMAEWFFEQIPNTVSDVYRQKVAAHSGR